jgi:hypothetical protein
MWCEPVVMLIRFSVLGGERFSIVADEPRREASSCAARP